MRHNGFFNRIKNLVFFEKTGIRVTLVVSLSVLFGATAMGALESYSSKDADTVIYYDSEYFNSLEKAVREREKALKKAAEEREKALKEAAEEREKAMRKRDEALRKAMEEREKAQRQAAEEREKALKKAAEEREKAMRKRDEALRKAMEEREKAQRQTAEEREKALKKAAKICSKAASQRTAKKTILTDINDTFVALSLIPETIYTGNVDRISASDCVRIVYQQGKPGKVEVLSALNAHSDVDIYIEDGVVYVSNHEIDNDNQPEVIVNVTSPSLSEVTLSGASSFSVNGAIEIPDILLVNTSGASEMNFGEIRGNMLDLRSDEASTIYVLTAEVDTLKASAGAASTMRIKGLNAGNVIADASAAGSIMLGGRCTALTVEETDAGTVNSKGLIVQTDYSVNKNETVNKVVPTSL